MKKKVLIALASMTIATVPFVGGALDTKTFAAAATPTITSVSKVVKPMYISKYSYMNIVDVTLAPSEDEGQIVSFTLSVYNGDSTNVSLKDYWFRLTNRSGSTYSLKMSAADSKKDVIAPYTKTYITMYAKVGEGVKLSDFIFKLIKFDFNVSNYEREVGRTTFPLKFTNEVKPTSYKALYFPTSILNTKISSASIGLSGDDRYMTMNFVYNNTGKRAITLSKYKYYVVNSAGIFYEATPSIANDLVIQPQTRQEFQLTATIPATLSTKDWKLIVERDSGDELGTLIPVGSYQVDFSGGNSSTVASDTFNYSNASGTYQYQLLNLLREPWQNQDILTARIRIKNTSLSVSSAVPNITGYFYLDNQLQLNYKTVTPSNQLGLNPSDYVDVDVYAQIPANYKFSTVKLIVNNQKDAQTSVKAGELSSTSYLSQLPTSPADLALNLTRDGSNMNASLDSVKVFNNVTSKTIKVSMTLSSNEKRAIDPLKLTGVFVNDNGDIFAADTVMANGKVNANHKAVVEFVTKLPLNYDSNNLKLIVGEGVTDTKYSSGTAIPEAYIGAVKYSLPSEQSTLTSMSNLAFTPYDLTINKFFPQVYNKDLQLTLNYDLIKNTDYDVYPTDRKFLMNIEAVDKNDGTTYVYSSQEFTMEGDSTSALQVGKDKNVTLKTTLNYDTIDLKLNYTAKLYEIVDGAKKLIAEHPFYWFIDNEWQASTN
jgi:hypothetical protein